MNNPLIRLREMQKEVSSTERNVAEYLISNPNEVHECTIRELAAKMFVSPSTIVRLCQHLGFEGYRDFRQAVIYELALYQNSNRANVDDISPTDSLEVIVEKVTYRNIKSLEETHNLLDLEKIKICVDLITAAKSVYLFGIGASFCVAKDAHLKFLRVDKTCFIGEDWHIQSVLSQNAMSCDVGIVISYSGETVEMVECMKHLCENKVPVIAITRFASSTIASMTDHVLYTSDSESIFRVGALSSRIAQLNMVDMLYTSYVTRNYEECIKRLRKTHINKPNV